MRIPLDIALTPGRNDPLMVGLVGASVFVFAYSTLFGPVAILFYYALWFPLAALTPGRLAAAALDAWPVLALTGLALLSVLWSAAPGTSLRSAVQLGTHVVCAITAARLVTARGLALGLAAGTLAVLAWSILFGRSSYDPIDGTYTFVGLFGSKNQLGFFASLAVLACAFAATLVGGWLWRGALAAAGLFALGVLLASDSATSILTLAVALGVYALALVLRRLNASTRLVLVLLGGLSVGAIAVIAVQGGVIEMVLGAFGKDATLTGRTYLWNEGLGVFGERPWSGTGYNAFWVHGFAHAERLWAEFYITARSGFHFHNTWIEALSALGVPGAVLVGLIFVGTLWRALVGTVAAREPLPFIFLLVLVVLLLARSMSEVDALTPFTIGSFLLFVAAVTVRHPLTAPRGRTRAAPTPAQEVHA